MQFRNTVLSLYLILWPLHGFSESAPERRSHGQDGQETGLYEEKAPLYLSLGEQRLLHIPDLQRYSLGGPAVHALPFPTQKGPSDAILLKGAQNGISDLWVWKKDGSAEHRTLQVDPRTILPISAELSKSLERLSEIEIVYSGTGVCLRGEIQSIAEAARVAEIARAFPNAVRDETEPSTALLDQAQSVLEKWLSTSPYAQRLQIAREDRSLRVILAQGSLRGPAERAALEKRIRSLYPLAQMELESLPDNSPTVHFKVFLLELRKTRFHNLGLGWPEFQESAFRVTTSSIQNLIQLDITLQSLEGEGSLKILSNPELVVRAPGEAELFSGGEIPIQTRTAYFSAVNWKTFGLTLKLNVTQSAGDRVRLDITTEVSHLDSTLSNEKIPGIQANRMKTQVDAQYGRPLLLSGLLQQNTRKEAKGLPILREIPVLGALFGSDDYLNEKSELVAILVPSKELPLNPMDRLRTSLPKGELPIARAPARPYASPEEEAKARDNPSFPWNVLE